MEIEKPMSVMEDDDYDYFKEIARSSYADMLHDHERNHLYYQAIKKAVKLIHAKGQKAVVLDIGTGTGLLSMMAATAGAEHITAIEMFTPMSRVAREVIKRNGFTNINVINKHSTEVTFGRDGDVKEKCNIIITELFDTELIGEGALVAYHHAHQNFMQEDCAAVPHSAITYAQVLQSEKMNSWYRLKPISLTNVDGKNVQLQPHPDMLKCPGVPAVCDIQLSQIKQEQFMEICKPFKIFEFPWYDRNLKPELRKNVSEVKVLRDGTAQIVISWWDLIMDTEGDIILSTAPAWHHPKANDLPWRDHWIQSVYSLPNEIQVRKNESLFVHSFHDDYSLWFNACQDKNDYFESLRPWCSYPAKLLWSRPRMAMLNNTTTHSMYARVLKDVGTCRKVLCIGDVGILPAIVALTLGKNVEVVSCEPNEIGCKALAELFQYNNISNIRMLNMQPEQLNEIKDVDVIITEPFFTESMLPWHDLRFWRVCTNLKNHTKNDITVLPRRGELKMAAVCFKDLWKIRAPVGAVEEFDVSVMDDMINNALALKEDHSCEPHAVWEYPCQLLTRSQTVLKFNFNDPMLDCVVNSKGDLQQTIGEEISSCNAVVFWMEYFFSDNESYSTGLLPSNEWNMDHKQGVYFIKDKISGKCLSYNISFDQMILELECTFSSVMS